MKHHVLTESPGNSSALANMHWAFELTIVASKGEFVSRRSNVDEVEVEGFHVHTILQQHGCPWPDFGWIGLPSGVVP